MKIADLSNPIMSSWFALNGYRLDSKPYLSGAMEAKALLVRLPDREMLPTFTLGGMKGLINAGRISRLWVNDRKYGIPFLSSTDVLQADLSNMSLISKKAVKHNPQLIIHEGWTLITRSGSIGRMVYARPDMDGMACTEDVLRVVPDPDKIRPGYLYAYLSSKFGVPQVVGGTYGAIIQHIEPQHIADLPVPRLGKEIEDEAHWHMAEAARLRSMYQTQIRAATEKLFSSVGLRDITASEWHALGRNLGFPRIVASPTLRALNYNPRLEAFLASLSQVPHMRLGDICADGELRSGLRFKRIDSDPKHGVKLIGQRELFWLEPEGRWIAPDHAPKDIFVQDETVVIAAQGTLGENEVFCRGEFITGPWLKYAYTQHLLRVRSGREDISGAFLFAFLRSEMAFRCLRSMSVGSKQQDLHRGMLADFPIPLPEIDERREIARMVRSAYEKRHAASFLEKRAVSIIEEAITDSAKRL